jgi:hypothetical protein
MKIMHLAAAALLGSFAAAAGATTIDFSALEQGTVVSNQFAGVVFTVSGGPGPDGAPVVDSFEGLETALLNSTTDNYPSNTFLTMVFTSPASNVSFRFNNFGFPEDEGGCEECARIGPLAGGGRGFSSWTAYDPSDNIIGGGDIFGIQDFSSVFVGSNVSTLVITNGNNVSDSWIFGVSSLSFNGAIPEPGSWAMMILGFGAIGTALRRRQAALPA